MRARLFAFYAVVTALSSGALLAQVPPQRAFGPDTTRTRVFTGAGATPLGLTCSSSASSRDCSGFLASDVDGTALDVTVRIPPGTPPFPLVVNLHGYGGSKTSSSTWDDKLIARGYAVLRYSARGFGKSWGQVNLADRDVELADLRSLIGQVVDDAQGLGLQLNADAVAVLGASYGGGQSWLAALQPSFDSPALRRVRIRTIVPIVPWTDLLASLRPNGDESNSIDLPGFYKLSFLEGLFLGGLHRDRDRPYPNYPDYLFAWNAYEYPIAEYFGDIGHPRAANKNGEVDYALDRALEWLDFHLIGKGAPPFSCGDPAAPQLRCDVLAAIT